MDAQCGYQEPSWPSVVASKFELATELRAFVALCPDVLLA